MGYQYSNIKRYVAKTKRWRLGYERMGLIWLNIFVKQSKSLLEMTDILSD